MENPRNYRPDLDLIKGISIVAVIFYHLGLSKSGYLGVDAFFVLNGFFIIPTLIRNIDNGSFRYFPFLIKRLIRLLPVLLISCVVCLVVGWFLMLPDDYENLSEQVFASSLFVNNILQAITTRNYWNVVNEFKPLMHTWYLGVLVQFYITFPLLIIALRFLCKRFGGTYDNWVKSFICLLILISFAGYVAPITSASNKFYYFPFRYFELLLGGMTGLFCVNIEKVKKHKALYVSSSAVFVLLLFYGMFFMNIRHLGGDVIPIGAKVAVTNPLLFPNWLLVSLACVCTSVMILCGNIEYRQNNILVLLGTRCYSLFIWHQIIFAFYRYAISSDISIFTAFALVFIVLVVSELSFRLIENSDSKKYFNHFVVLIASFLLVLSSSLWIYAHAGVVRDVPELGVYRNNVSRNMHSKYSDRIYNEDRDFEYRDGAVNVLVIGNSFARDWANVLLESPYANHINLSYHFLFEESILDRIKDSDYIFVFMDKEDVPEYVWNNIHHDNVWGIGTKNFGESSGNIYSKRFTDGYYDTRIKLSQAYIDSNDAWKKSWGDHYVDLISCVADEDYNVRVFSDSHLLLSQDGHHLTCGGAHYFASIIDFDSIFKEKPKDN